MISRHLFSNSLQHGNKGQRDFKQMKYFFGAHKMNTMHSFLLEPIIFYFRNSRNHFSYCCYRLYLLFLYFVYKFLETGINENRLLVRHPIFPGHQAWEDGHRKKNKMSYKNLSTKQMQRSTAKQ